MFFCSFGYDTVKILVKGQGGLPNCLETRLDIPCYVERVIREAHRREVVRSISSSYHSRFLSLFLLKVNVNKVASKLFSGREVNNKS